MSEQQVISAAVGPQRPSSKDRALRAALGTAAAEGRARKTTKLETSAAQSEAGLRNEYGP